MINKFKEDPQFFMAFAAMFFVSMFTALFIYFFIFPVNTQIVGQETQPKTILGIDPLALETAKTWNQFNFDTKEIPVDSCNKITRIDNVTLQITLRRC